MLEFYSFIVSKPLRYIKVRNKTWELQESNLYRSGSDALQTGHCVLSFPWVSSSSQPSNHRDVLEEDSLAIRPVFLFFHSIFHLLPPCLPPTHPPHLRLILLLLCLIYTAGVKTMTTLSGGWEIREEDGRFHWHRRSAHSAHWAVFEWTRFRPGTINSHRCPWGANISGQQPMRDDLWARIQFTVWTCLFL